MLIDLLGWFWGLQLQRPILSVLFHPLQALFDRREQLLESHEQGMYHKVNEINGQLCCCGGGAIAVDGYRQSELFFFGTLLSSDNKASVWTREANKNKYYYNNNNSNKNRTHGTHLMQQLFKEEIRPVSAVIWTYERIANVSWNETGSERMSVH